MSGFHGLHRHLPLHPAAGSIHLILGPMFSGKSTELLRRMRRYAMAKYKCFFVKYANDTRYGDGIVTHDKQRSDAIACSRLEDIKQKASGYDVVGIDEGQFFPDILEVAEELANNGKLVIVAALDGTFQRKPFNNILQLVPRSESVIKLTAVCMMCHTEAAFSKRLGTETEVEVIGGADKYIAVCRECFHKGEDAASPANADSQTPQKIGVTPEVPSEGVTRQLFDDTDSGDASD
eukprot:m.6893 g.6893  ORF g.6893 m.6893 type:complete len:235 (-) comp5203_c0_seq1:2360-3064(-)